jgi:hypothetical protein
VSDRVEGRDQGSGIRDQFSKDRIPDPRSSSLVPD